MKLTFQTFSLFILVTMVHLVVLVGFSKFSDESSTILSDLNGEEILEEWFGEQEKEPSSVELAEGTDDEKLPDNPIARAETDKQPEPDLREALREETLPEDRSAAREEVSAIVDARLLSGRIEAPNVEAYLADPTPVVVPEPNAVESAKPLVPELKAEPIVASPVKSEKKQEAPAVEGPRKIRSIRPISG